LRLFTFRKIEIEASAKPFWVKITAKH
jgi:hypothetical protein